jgi:cysteinyl-tRNA synthetase
MVSLWEFPIGSYGKLSSAVTKLKIEKRGDEIKKKSSPLDLKLLSQSQPNFVEMILGWFPSKLVSGISDLQPRWPPQPNLI